jgi:hypothetical protein
MNKARADDTDDGPDLDDDRQVLQRMPTVVTSAMAVSRPLALDQDLPHDVRGIGLYLCAKLEALPQHDTRGLSTRDLRVAGTSAQRVLAALAMLRDRGHLTSDFNPIFKPYSPRRPQ